MKGNRTRAMLEGGRVRALAVDVEEIAAHAAVTHELHGAAAELCAEGITAAALLAAYLDEGERLTLQVQAEKPRFSLMVDVYEDGGVRARMSPSSFQPADTIEGVMLVIKSVVGREVYRGATAISHASLQEMLQAHLQTSDQVAARVVIDGGKGAFVEPMPGEVLPDDHLDMLAISSLILLTGEDLELRWSCTCSRERILGMLASLPGTEIQSMIDEDGGAAVTCHFCNETERVSASELAGLIAD